MRNDDFYVKRRFTKEQLKHCKESKQLTYNQAIKLFKDYDIYECIVCGCFHKRPLKYAKNGKEVRTGSGTIRKYFTNSCGDLDNQYRHLGDGNREIYN